MKHTPLSQVLADDLLLDRIGARLDTDDQLGSLLLSLAHHVDAPVSRPSVRGRRRRNHRALTVLAALGIAVSGATVAAAIESAPDAPATAGGSAHTRFLPQALQALGLPFAGPGLAQGRVLPSPPGADASFRPYALTSTGLPASLMLDTRGSASGPGGSGTAAEQQVGGTSAAAASSASSGSSATSGSSSSSGSSALSPASASPASPASAGPSGGRALGSSASNPASTTGATSGDGGEQEASGAPKNGATKTPAAKSQNGESASEPTGSTHTPTSSPTSAPTGGNVFAGTGNAGQGTSHAATPATPGSSGTPAIPATPARRSATTPPGQGGGNAQGSNGVAKGKVVDPSTPTVPAPVATTAASATPTGP